MIHLHFSETLAKLNMDSLMKAVGTVIVGYSGGADSSCLLYLLNGWCRENGVHLVAAHMNHMIRGDEADRDEAFCRKCAASLGVPIYVKRVDIPALSEKNGRGLEETARTERYSFFSEISRELTGREDGAVISTAHNASDNLETVLMNLMRGTGLHGMCGIQPVRDGRIIRPLICDSGEDIRQWCRENGVEFVFDSTNAGTDCTRNVLRNKIVPLMREICPSPEDSVTRMTSSLRDDDVYILEKAQSVVGDGGKIGRDVLLSLEKPIAARVLMMLYNRAKTSDSTLSSDNIGTLLRLAAEKNGHSSLSLPGKVRAVIERDVISFETENGIVRENRPDVTEFEYTGGFSVYENGLYRVTFSDKPIDILQKSQNEENIYKKSTQGAFDCAKIKGRLIIRAKTDGDKYVFGGHTHKLKKMFVDSKLTEAEKRSMPVIADENGILWVPGYPVRDGVGCSDGDRIHILCEKL